MAIVRNAPVVVNGGSARAARGLVVLLSAAIMLWLLWGPAAATSAVGTPASPIISSGAPSERPAALPQTLHVATDPSIGRKSDSASAPMREADVAPTMTTTAPPAPPAPPPWSPTTLGPARLPAVGVPPSTLAMNDAARRTRDAIERSGHESIPISWPRLRRAPSPEPPASGRTQGRAGWAAAIKDPQPMAWTHETCEPKSFASGVRGKRGMEPSTTLRWKSMRGVGDCAFASVGSFPEPVDAGRLAEHAAAVLKAAADPRRPGHARFLCRPAQLQQTSSSVQFVARRKRRAPAAGGQQGPTEKNRTATGPDAGAFSLGGVVWDDLVGAKLRHAQCELPDPDRPYEWLVLLTAAARAAGQAHASVALVGDSVHRNLMAALIAVMRGQRETVVDRQAHVPVRYVLMERGDVWEAGKAAGAKFGSGSVGGLGDVLLEITFGPSFGHHLDIPTSIVPRSPPEYATRHATAIVGGGLLHREGCRDGRQLEGDELQSYAGRVVDYAENDMPTGQTYIFRGSSGIATRADEKMPTTHNWKDFVYRTAARLSSERVGDRPQNNNDTATSAAPTAAAGLPQPPRYHATTNVYFLDGLLSKEHTNVGMQPPHPQLGPTDGLHYTCVASPPVPEAFTRWRWDWWQCRSYHDKAHASLIVAMTAARFVLSPPHTT